MRLLLMDPSKLKTWIVFHASSAFIIHSYTVFIIIKSVTKEIYNVTKDFYFKQMLFF